MAIQAPAVNVYDEVPYTTQALVQSHPDRMATIGRLFGMHPPRIDRARVLELGCGTGANLIPMADRHPESNFIGIDYSLVQVEAGRRAIEQLGLTNIKLEHASIADIGAEFGLFDYIIVHGVFSWVSEDLQEKLLSICQANLTTQGIAYISYNAYPAWHLRGMTRELSFATSSTDEPPQQRIAKVKRVVEFLSFALADDQSNYAKLVKANLDFVVKQPDDYIFHEFFEEENRPIYFHQFAQCAAEHGLQYLGDAMIDTMFAANLGQKIEHNLLAVSDDVISMEQHMDLLKNRMFRFTLLCHDDVPLRRHLSLESLRGLYLAGNLQPASASPNLVAEGVESFITAKKGVIASPAPPVKCALAHLSRIWPAAISVDALIEAVEKQLTASGKSALSPADRQGLGDNLAQCLANRVIEVYSSPDSFVTSVCQRPLASPLVRMQAAAGRVIINRRHQVVMIDDVLQNTLVHLDGRNDRSALTTFLLTAIDQGRLSILRDGLPVGRQEVEGPVLEAALGRCLAQLASLSVLIA